MIIRVQSDQGTRRIEVSEFDQINKLFELTADAFKLESDSDWRLSRSRKIEDAFRPNSKAMIKSSKLKHGDMLYVIKEPKPSSSRAVEQPAANAKLEDEVDKILENMDGRIRRSKGHLCHHPDNGVCIHCVPLEPYDPDYLSLCDPPVKFMSFHAYLRKVMGGQNKGKFTRLESVRCTVRPGCTTHAPWPDGICTQCQPRPVTLEVQAWRHVDFVQFENAEAAEAFLDAWRATGCQRVGLLLGTYEAFAGTPGAPPLAIKAVVAAIYEPPQESTPRSVRLTCPLDQLMPPEVEATARALGLKPIGWIFTDLTADDSAPGAVKHYRGDMETYFLSAQECITAARLQNLHPNVTRHSAEGVFGSKFVTVVVTGDRRKEIHFEAYQVSNVAMSLEAAGIIVPTYDAPELAYVCETSRERFAPDVLYSMTDKYGNKVTRLGRPLPVEYLLVDMPTAFPKEQTFTFAEQATYHIPKRDLFPIENRETFGERQSVEAFARHYAAYGGRERLYGCLNNFHVLAWLATQTQNLPLDAESFRSLLTVLRTRGSVEEWANSSPAWASLELILQALATGHRGPSATSPLSPRSSNLATTLTSGSGGRTFRDAAISGVEDVDEEGTNYWACKHCTLHNQLHATECEMCGLPRDA